jgi:hypothetical protein
MALMDPFVVHQRQVLLVLVGVAADSVKKCKWLF